jgi:hypothetical protein
MYRQSFDTMLCPLWQVSVPSLFGISSFDQPVKKSFDLSLSVYFGCGWYTIVHLNWWGQTCSDSDSDHGDSSQSWPQKLTFLNGCRLSSMRCSKMKCCSCVLWYLTYSPKSSQILLKFDSRIRLSSSRSQPIPTYSNYKTVTAWIVLELGQCTRFPLCWIPLDSQGHKKLLRQQMYRPEPQEGSTPSELISNISIFWVAGTQG